MNPCTLLACLALATAPPEPDRWIGEDKLQHFFVSFVATSLAAGGARLAGVDRPPAVVVGVSFGAGAGIWKELRDRRLGRAISVRDLVWDAAGVGLAAVVASRTR